MKRKTTPLKTSEGRVKNTKPISKFGINFRSTAEANLFEILRNRYTAVKYEPQHFELMPAFKLGFASYRCCTYTPDFLITLGNQLIYIELKGFMETEKMVKYKMFAYNCFLNNMTQDPKIYFYVVKNNKVSFLKLIRQLDRHLESLPECKEKVTKHKRVRKGA